jgi:hypothetical protein
MLSKIENVAAYMLYMLQKLENVAAYMLTCFRNLLLTCFRNVLLTLLSKIPGSLMRTIATKDQSCGFNS